MCVVRFWLWKMGQINLQILYFPKQGIIYWTNFGWPSPLPHVSAAAHRQIRECTAQRKKNPNLITTEFPINNTRLFCANRGWVLTITRLNFLPLGVFLEISSQFENSRNFSSVGKFLKNFSSVGKFVESSYQLGNFQKLLISWEFVRDEFNPSTNSPKRYE